MTPPISFPVRMPLLAAGLSACIAATPLPAQDSGPASRESRILARAASAERAGRVDEARRDLESVLDANPTSPAALAMLSQLLTPRGRAAEVVPFAERAVAQGQGVDPIAMQVWIRALDATGERDSALAVAARWSSDRPQVVAAYSELARLQATAGRTDEAVATLEAARTASGDSTVLAQELSELMASNGDYDGAAREWTVMLGWGEIGVSAVSERIRSPGVDTRAAVTAMSDELSDPRLPVHVRRGGLALAVALDEREWARSLAIDLTDSVPAETRRLILRDYYVESHNRDWPDDASWAAGRLVEESLDEAERRHWRAMGADVAYRSGDAGEAERTFEELTRTATPGTETHRRSLRRLFSLRTSGRSPEAGSLLRQYSAAYPEDDAEIVGMAIELSNARVAARDLEGAASALDLAGGPSDASLESRIAGQRGVLALLEGRPGRALAELETAVFIPGGDPVRRTDALLLVQLLESADSSQAAELGAGMLGLLAERDPEPLVRSAEGWSSPTQAGRAGPGLLSLAAGALDREGFPVEAAALRKSLLEGYPEAREAPSAMLELGRSATANDPDQARAWFEKLVVSYPEHALAPIARQELSSLAGDE